MRSNGVVLLSLLLTAPAATFAQSAIEPATEGLAALVRSYPEFLEVWRLPERRLHGECDERPMAAEQIWKKPTIHQS